MLRAALAPYHPSITNPMSDSTLMPTDAVVQLDDDALAVVVEDLSIQRDQLVQQLDEATKRDAILRVAVREWGRRHFGSLDAFCVEIADRMEVSISHVRSSLYQRGRSRDVVDEAVAIYRERTGGGDDDPASVVVGRIGTSTLDRPPLRAAA